MSINTIIEKIAIICYPARSGLTQYSYCLCKELSKYCNNLYFITNKAVEFNDEELKCRTIRLFTRTRWLFFDLFRFMSFILKEKIFYLHFQSAIKNVFIDFFILLFFKLCRRKIIFTAHDILPHERKNCEIFIIKLLYRFFDIIIVHSPQNKNFLSSLNFSLNNVHVIPHGLYDMFLPSKEMSMQKAKEELSLKTNGKIILFFGSINPRKGAEQVVRGFNKIITRQKDVYLVLAGIVDYPEGYLEKIAKEVGVKENLIIFSGWVPDDRVNLFFSAADMIILPYKEGFTSGVLKLAYAFKKPVIASTVGELAEIITNEQTGILLDEFFSEQTADLVLKVLNSPELLSKYKKNIEKVARQKYSWNTIADKTANVYYKFIKNKEGIIC